MSPGDGYFRRQRLMRRIARWALIAWLLLGVLLGIGYLIGQL